MTSKTLMPLSHFFDGACTPNACRPHAEEGTLRHRPRTDMLEGEQDYIIRMDLPGVNRDDLNIEIDGEALSISAERKLTADEGYRNLRSERPAKVLYKRSFELGQRIDHENISASLVDGMLTLTLPKSSQAVVRRIEVK